MSNDLKEKQMSRGAQRRARYREIAAVLWEERLLDYFRGAGLEEYLSKRMVGEETPGIREKDLSLEVRVRHALERLGPVFIKIGQLLAARGDLVSPALLEELAKLQDDVPSVPWPEMRTRIEAELGAPIADLFDNFDDTPLAAASLGQVYRAALPNGTSVAVKVQRPGVREAMEIDLDILHDVAGRLAKHVQWCQDNNIAGIAENFADLLRNELDYALEGRSLDRFRSAFADDPSVVFPRVYWDQTTSCVLTMDLIEGVPATALGDNGMAAGVDRAHMVQLGVGAYFRMIFKQGFYHADPHAGNLFALPEGRLGFVDCGRVAAVSERYREGTFDMLMAILDNDPTAVTEALLAMTGMPPHVNLAAFEIDINALLSEYGRKQSSGKGLDKFMKGLLKLMRTHQVQVPTELAVLLPTLGVLEGVALQLDPAFNMLDVTKPFARKFMPERYGMERIIKTSLRSARAYGRFFEDLPVHATRALRRMGEGEFRVVVRPEDYAELVDRFTAGFYLLAYALIVGALIIGLSSLVGRQELGQPEQIAYRVVLYAAIASVIWLFFRSLRNEWRKRHADRLPR